MGSSSSPTLNTGAVRSLSPAPPPPPGLFALPPPAPPAFVLMAGSRGMIGPSLPCPPRSAKLGVSETAVSLLRRKGSRLWESRRSTPSLRWCRLFVLDACTGREVVVRWLVSVRLECRMEGCGDVSDVESNRESNG